MSVSLLLTRKPFCCSPQRWSQGQLSVGMGAHNLRDLLLLDPEFSPYSVTILASAAGTARTAGSWMGSGMGCS